MDWSAIWTYLFELGASVGLKLLMALVVVFIGHKLIKVLKKWILTSHKLDKVDVGVRSFLASFAKIALYIVLFITVAMILGIPTTSFITALASCGVAIGLAMQGSLSNFAGGIMILIFKPFKVGDYISTATASGTVEEITVVYTILKTPDNKMVTIPNGAITNAVVENYSAHATRRVDIDFNVEYGCDVDKVKGVLLDIMQENSMILKDPEPFARISAHNENNLTYTIRAWCKTEDYWDVNFDLREKVKKEFEAQGISIPLPVVRVEK